MKTIPVNPRIVACTHRNLDEMVSQQEFREDLFFRLSVLKLEIPALRERKEDIPLLTHTFIKKFNASFNKNVRPPSSEVMARIENHDWPGNIRELQNAIERAVVLSSGGELKIEDLIQSSERDRPRKGSVPLEHDQARRDFEERYVRNLLEKAHGNVSEAARLAGKHRVEIYRLMKKFKITRGNYLRDAGQGI